jgi:hypothetical protein
MRNERRVAALVGLGLLLLLIIVALSACGDSNADKASKNLGEKCERFECQRRIVGINGITDKVLFDVEGRCSIEKNKELQGTLTILCKHANNDYRKHFIGIPDNVTFVSTQLEGIQVSEYRTKIILRPEKLLPDLDLVTGDQR